MVGIGTDIAFNTNGIMTAGITHAVGSNTLQFATAGVYRVSFFVGGVEPGQFALFRNGVVVAGTIYGSGAGTQGTTGQAILTIAAGDLLSLRNHSSAAAVTLQVLAGGTQANVNASILVERID